MLEMAAGKTFQKITCHNQMAQEIQSSKGWPESGLQSCPALMLSCQVHIMPRGRDPKPVCSSLESEFQILSPGMVLSE